MACMDGMQTSYHSELQFYWKFHRHPINRGIHVIAVPMEWFCAMIWIDILAFVVIGFLNDDEMTFVLATRRISTTMNFLLGIYFCMLDIIPGLAACLTIAILEYGSALMYHTSDGSIPFILGWTAFINVGSWIVQVHIGHRIYEKNMPAMATQLTFHSVILSLLFVAHEYVWVLGYQTRRRDALLGTKQTT